jgi:uncharacterized membrane-anchored protein
MKTEADMAPDGARNGAGAFFPEHEARAAILSELHARPFLPLEAPRRIYHYAFATNHEEAQTDRTTLTALAHAHNVAPPAANSRFYYFAFGAWRLRWEQHTEFTTYSWSTGVDAETPFGHGDPLRDGEIAFTPPGRLIVATHLCVVDRAVPLDTLTGLFNAQSLCVVGVDRNSAHVVTDFALDSHGYTRFAVRLMNAPALEAGRLAQRLLEIETYRTMALLGLPLAHDVSPHLRAMERELSEITQSLSIAHDSRTSHDLLRRLSDLLAKSEALSTRAAFRFGASRAYHALVKNRLALLQESPVGPYGTLSSFLSVRFDPAIETCNAVEARQTRFSRDVERANDLMRTGITLEMERQNGALLEDLNRRNRLQMRLNRMVQGISIAGLAYYLVGIFAFASRGLQAAGVFGEGISAEAASALGLPVALLLSWAYMARVQYLSRRAAEEEDLR